MIYCPREFWEWPWSSAAAHMAGRGDALVKAGGPLVAEVSNWRRFLIQEDAEETVALLRRHGRTGRPLGGARFLGRLERRLGRSVLPGRPGRPPKRQEK